MVSEAVKDRLLVLGLSALYILIVFAVVCGIILALMLGVWWLMLTFSMGPMWFIFGGLAPVLTAVIVIAEWSGV